MYVHICMCIHVPTYNVMQKDCRMVVFTQTCTRISVSRSQTYASPFREFCTLWFHSFNENIHIRHVYSTLNIYPHVVRFVYFEWVVYEQVAVAQLSSACRVTDLVVITFKRLHSHLHWVKNFACFVKLCALVLVITNVHKIDKYGF